MHSMIGTPHEEQANSAVDKQSANAVVRTVNV